MGDNTNLMKTSGIVLLKNLILFLFLYAIVLCVNESVVAFNLMYPEQPSIYIANQTIHHISDLINIYLHPKLLNKNIPFFRPSGHFLLYQIFMPYFGWHNTKALFIINFGFLALIGWFIIVLYKRLFNDYVFGGYVAFSLYLMHPALSLARITLMHFEFAYVLFLMMALTVFVVSCQKTGKYKHSTFILSLFLYILAMTFKEPAIMLGPVFMLYYWMAAYHQQPIKNYVANLFNNKKSIVTMLAIFVTSLLCSIYLIASWPNVKYPSTILSYYKTIGTINSFFIDVWGLHDDLIPYGKLAFHDLAWRTILFPDAVRAMLWSFVALTLVAMVVLFGSSNKDFANKKSVLFLLMTACAFLILPFAWATGGPWHYTLTLIFISMIMGFSFEYLIRRMNIRKTFAAGFYLLVIMANLFLAVYVNKINIDKYDHVEDGRIGLAANRNAVFNPPDIRSQLTPDSMIVVEDSQIHNDYLLGNAVYPFLLFMGDQDYDRVAKEQSKYFLKFPEVYGGNLFRYAYLMPSIKEQLYPFNAEDLSLVPNEILYKWLKQGSDIFCFGYDVHGVWHDKTAVFKAQLLKENQERELVVHHYQSISVAFQSGKIEFSEVLPYPDPELCAYRCDQSAECKSFIYKQITVKNHEVIQCFYSGSAVFSPNKTHCAGCTWYTRNF